MKIEHLKTAEGYEHYTVICTREEREDLQDLLTEVIQTGGVYKFYHAMAMDMKKRLNESRLS